MENSFGRSYGHVVRQTAERILHRDLWEKCDFHRTSVAVGVNWLLCYSTTLLNDITYESFNGL